MKTSFEMIQDLMGQEGLSKKDLASIAGVGPSAVTKWASGGAIRMGALCKIAAHFHVPVASLYPQEDGQESSLSVNQSEIDWRSRALLAEEKLKTVQEALALILKGTQKLQEAVR